MTGTILVQNFVVKLLVQNYQVCVCVRSVKATITLTVLLESIMLVANDIILRVNLKQVFSQSSSLWYVHHLLSFLNLLFANLP